MVRFLLLPVPLTSMLFLSANALYPYYSEVAPIHTYTVDNDTLVPLPSPNEGLALQMGRQRQVHTHVNILFPAYINDYNCLCQLSLSLDTAAPGSKNEGELDIFELAAPTNETFHPPITGYYGRVSVEESNEVRPVFGMQPFNCSGMQLGGQIRGYEVAPKWWDEDGEVHVQWHGNDGLFLRVWGMAA